MRIWPTRKNRSPQGILGVSECSEGVAVAQVLDSDTRPRIVCNTFLEESTDRRGPALQELARQQSLGRLAGVGVMDPGSYNLLQIELPEVPEAEINQAVRWLVKDLLEFPLEEAVIDHFSVPGGHLGRSRLGYAVAARRSAVLHLAKLLQEARLRVAAIDIPEMALHHLACRLPESGQGVALLYPGRTRSLITICRQGSLYLSRTVGVGTDSLASWAEEVAGEPVPQLQELLAAMVLEVQRSLDFYESHFGQTPVAALAVAPMETPVTGMLPYLQRSLGVPVRSFDLGEIFDPCPLPPTEQARCLLAIGAALRPELP